MSISSASLTPRNCTWRRSSVRRRRERVPQSGKVSKEFVETYREKDIYMVNGVPKFLQWVNTLKEYVKTTTWDVVVCDQYLHTVEPALMFCFYRDLSIRKPGRDYRYTETCNDGDASGKKSFQLWPAARPIQVTSFSPPPLLFCLFIFGD